MGDHSENFSLSDEFDELLAGLYGMPSDLIGMSDDTMDRYYNILDVIQDDICNKILEGCITND